MLETGIKVGVIRGIAPTVLTVLIQTLQSKRIAHLVPAECTFACISGVGQLPADICSIGTAGYIVLGLECT